MHNKNLSELMQTIHYEFENIDLLKNALTHSSYANEKCIKKYKDNERLEFLGDAVLELTSSDYIYKNYADMDEGRMTRLRASIVCEPTLAICARAIGLDKFVMLGKGEELTGGRKRDSIISDACVGSYRRNIPGWWFANAKEFVTSFILNDLENKQLFYDSKTILQEVVQAAHKEVVYEIIDETGPEHDKNFIAKAYVEGMFEVTANGHTKKHAEQRAAYEALVYLKKHGQA